MRCCRSIPNREVPRPTLVSAGLRGFSFFFALHSLDLHSSNDAAAAAAAHTHTQNEIRERQRVISGRRGGGGCHLSGRSVVVLRRFFNWRLPDSVAGAADPHRETDGKVSRRTNHFWGCCSYLFLFFGFPWPKGRSELERV